MKNIFDSFDGLDLSVISEALFDLNHEYLNQKPSNIDIVVDGRIVRQEAIDNLLFQVQQEMALRCNDA